MEEGQAIRAERSAPANPDGSPAIPADGRVDSEGRSASEGKSADHQAGITSYNTGKPPSPSPWAVIRREEEDPETGVSLQVPEFTAPALVDLDGFSAVSRPRPPPRPAVLLWRHLSCADVRAIRGASTLTELREVIGLRCPEVLHASAGSPASLLLEMLLYVLQYARERELTEQQTSVVFSVAKATHDYATSTCFGNVAETFGYFRDLLAAHCVNRPPWSLDLFEPAVAEHFARFFADMYFRHFSLVKAAFTPHLTLDVDVWYEPRVWRSPEELAAEQALLQKDQEVEEAKTMEKEQERKQ